MKLLDFIKEFKYVEPRDEAHYRQLMKDLQDIQKDPTQYAIVGKMNFMKRKAALDTWADKHLNKNENMPAEPAKCTHCDGIGKHGDKDCEVCGGKGYTTEGSRLPSSMIANKQKMDHEAEHDVEALKKRFQARADQYNANRKPEEHKTAKDMAASQELRIGREFAKKKPYSKHFEEDGLQSVDVKRVGAVTKSMYVHKDGKTIMIPAEREKEFIQKGYKRSALRTEESFKTNIIKKLVKPIKDYNKEKENNKPVKEADIKMDKAAFVSMLANKIQQPQAGLGKPEYDNRLLAKMYKLLTGKDVDFSGDKFTILGTPKKSAMAEGASMIPYYKTEKDWEGQKRTVWEFPDAWTNDKELNPPYMSNASMREFLSGLGYSADFEEMSAVPVEEFIGRTTQWLKKHIDKQSPEQEPTVDQQPGKATMISGGKPEGWMNAQVKYHNELARKIKAKYPEVTHLGFN